MGGGGGIQNSVGGWIMGFFNGFHLTTNNHMKLLALREGLQLAEKSNFTPIEINVNFLEVILMPTKGNSVYNDIVDDCRSRIRRLGNPHVVHCYREQNGVADALAKLGANSDIQQGSRLFKVPPMCAQNAVWADIAGTHFIRLLKTNLMHSHEELQTSFVLNPD
ncbi:hypothetical protein FXO38_29423 [Capsicum annuum]|nr:hypothetical protein FXO38_29423 [Capsicum annuum]